MANKEAEGKKGKKRKAEEIEEAETRSSVSEEAVEADKSSSESESESESPNNKTPEAQPRGDRFREYYMKILTEEFGDDLDTLRKDKNFDEKKSLPILIRSLEQGMNIFSAEERKLILEQS